MRGEDADHGGPLVDLQHVGQRLENVKVEEGISGDGAVESRLHGNKTVTNGSSHSDGRQRGVTFRNEVQYRSRTLGEPPLSFLHTRATRENTTWTEREDTPLRSGAPPPHRRQVAVGYLAQRGVLHRHLPQEEVHVVPVVDGVQEVRLCKVQTSLHHRQAAVGGASAVGVVTLASLTSQPLGVVLDGPEDRALVPQAPVDDGVAGQEVRHGGRVKIPT